MTTQRYPALNRYLDEICIKIENCPNTQARLFTYNCDGVCILYSKECSAIGDYVKPLHSYYVERTANYNIWFSLFPNVKNKVIIYNQILKGPFRNWSLVINCIHNCKFYRSDDWGHDCSSCDSDVEVILIENKKIKLYPYRRSGENHNAHCSVM